MKDSEFIELLNLYVDHEISRADAARLEAEVQGNPLRRQTYQEYCRMQKACKLLAHDFQTVAVPATDAKVLAFEPAARSARQSGIYIAGALVAAAACVTLIFVGRGRDDSAAQPQFARQNSTPVTTPAVAAPEKGSAQMIAQTANVPTRRAQGQPTLVGDPLLLTGRAQAGTMLATTGDQTDAQFAWMNAVQLAPLQPTPVEALRFERPASLQPGGPTYGSRQLPESGTEWIGFNFRK